MTLYDTINIIEQIALQQPNVRTAKEGNVFDHLNANPSVQYAAVILTQGQHQQDEQFNHFRFSIFYVDRLESDLDSNRIQIQSTGKEVLNNIIRTLTSKFDAECDDITYQPFTQRFADECAGVFASVVIDVPVDYLCAEDYADSDWESGRVVIRNQIKSIDIIANGHYNVTYDEGYTGLENVAIEVNVPTGSTINNQDKKVSLSLSTATISSSVTADAGYTGLGTVEIEADASLYGQSQYQSGHTEGYAEGYESGYTEGSASVTLQSKSVEVVANGEQTVSPDSGYSGMSAVTLNVNVPTDSPCNLQAKEVTYEANDTYQIVPDEDYDGMSALSVTVNVPTGGTGNVVLSNLNAIANGVYYPSAYPRNYLHFLGDSYFEDTLDNDFGLNITFRISSGATGYLIKTKQSSDTADISLDGASSSISIDFLGWTATIPLTLDEWHTLTLSPHNNILKIDGNDVQASGSQSGSRMYFCNWCYQANFTDIYEFNKWNHYSSNTAPYDRNWIAMERDGQPCFYDIINNEYKTFTGSNPEYETEAIDGWSSVTVNVEGQHELQEKRVEIAKDITEVTPDGGYYGLSSVSVDATAYGNKKYNDGRTAQRNDTAEGASAVTYSTNGTFYAAINEDTGEGYISAVTVNVPIDTCNLQSKSVTYTTNDTFQVTPDAGYDGMSALSVTVNVPQTTGGTLQIQDGTKMSDSTFSAIPANYDFSQVRDFGGMFAGAADLQSVSEGDIDTSGGIYFNAMFFGCTSLTSISGLDTSGAITLGGMLCKCTSLTSIQELDASSLEFMATEGLFWSDISPYPNLTDAGGLKNLKISIEDWNWNLCPNLSLQSCLNILNGLYDFTGHGEQPGEGQGKLKVHPNFIALVGDDISIATDKGWQVSA